MLAVLVLAIGACGIGATEFGASGLLPHIAREYGVSIPDAGYAVSGYAMGVVISAPLMALLSTRLPARRLLILLMALFTAGNVIAAVAPTFAVLLVGRVVTSLAHAAFFGAGSLVAARLAPPGKQAQAIAHMFVGLTLANVVAVPLGTFVGEYADWRLTFALIAALGAVTTAGIARYVPHIPAPPAGPGAVARQLKVFRSPQLLMAMAMTVLGFGGVFAVLTYIAPLLTRTAGYGDGAVTWLLALFGVGMTFGNVIGGRCADRSPKESLLIALAGLALALATFTVTSSSKPAVACSLAVTGALGFATVPLLQKLVLDHAADAPAFASALNFGAFNLGNGLAAWLGGLAIGSGTNYAITGWVGAALATLALAIALASTALQRRTPNQEGAKGHRRSPAPSNPDGGQTVAG